MLLHTLNRHDSQKKESCEKETEKRNKPEWFNEDLRPAIRKKDKSKDREQHYLQV